MNYLSGKLDLRRMFAALLTSSFLVIILYQIGLEETNKAIFSMKDAVASALLPKTVENVLTGRRKRVQKICARIGGVTGATTELSGIKSSNMSYCVVPKAGCTMWIRLFKFMEGQNKSSGDPMTLTKDMIHNKFKFFYKKLNRTREDGLFIARSVRVMTVRNPYTRLWSAYIDKFLLPDFWLSRGRDIVQQARPNPSLMSTLCGHDVTFPEFIKYVIKSGHTFRHWNQDKHWLPVSDICDPCVFDPYIIGKQETFMADLTYTLKQVKLDFLLPKITSVNPTEYEIKDIIDYNFKIAHRVENCTDVYEICKRVWTALILNGYLPSEEAFPTNIYEDSLNADSFYQLVTAIRTKYKITSAEAKKKRRHALSTAYQQIPAEHIKELQKLYKLDFELFDYNSEPDFLHDLMKKN